MKNVGKKIKEAMEKDEKRQQDEDVDMEVSESKRSKVDDERERLQRKRQSETDVRDLDAERSERDEAAQSSGSKRQSEVPVEEIDSERRERLGGLEKSGARAPDDSRFSFNHLERVYLEDGHCYEQDDLAEVLHALTTFGDLPSVAEVYSPPRVAAQAMTVGLRPGFSIDMGTLKPDGTPWNLESEQDYRVLKAWRNEEKPVLLCGSPPCNAFSKIQTWNRSRMKPGTQEELHRTGRLHLTRCIELYKAQMKDNLFFLHEFPSGSSSVFEPCLQDLLRRPGVMKVRGPMCFWGMTSSDHEG